MKHHYKNPVTYLPLLSWIFEVISLMIVAAVHDSICVQARELSTRLYIFIICVYSFILSDLFNLSYALFLPDQIIRPFGAFYNIVAGIFCFFGSIILASGLTFCGNKAQKNFTAAFIFGTLAATTHLLTAFLISRILPK